jgi:hypothetical protein
LEVIVTRNPYAPPKAEVSDPLQDATAPALWNPGAAANWSLLFSAAFGAFLQMQNWEALGEPGKASAAKKWFLVTLMVLAAAPVVSVLLPGNKSVDPGLRLLTIALLIGWYFSSGQSQMRIVKSRFGKLYPRRGWGKPILFGVLAVVGYVVYAAAIISLASLFTHRT